MPDLAVISLSIRVTNALVAYVTYIGKTIWPQDLAVYYPYSVSIPHWHSISSLLLLSLVSTVAVRLRRRYPYLIFGWLWFIITMLPVSGLLQVGSQSMADRYTYIPVIGLFIMAAWGVPDLLGNIRHRQMILALTAGAIMVAATALTVRQLAYWQDNTSLYRHTLQITRDNKKIHYQLGRALSEKGDLTGAIKEFQEIIRLTPNDSDAYYNLGLVLTGSGNLDSAIEAYRTALQFNPNDRDTRTNLGHVLARKRALEIFRK
jgi:tetratricopeptide (TPR) repeat protein